MKRLISLLLAAAMACLLLGGCKKDTTPLKLLDSGGLQRASANDLDGLSQDGRGAYWEIAIDQATQILATLEGCSQEDAQEKLLTGGYTLQTTFDQQVYQALEQVYKSLGSSLQAGIAVTDLQGNLLAVYSSRGSNYAAQANAPYSTLKPLSVYAPAIEGGYVQWNSFYQDSPYKQLSTGDCTLTDWPSNASGDYSMKYTNIAQGLRQSLNTVAVKCLADVGVEHAMTFLENNFRIDLTGERATAQIYSTEEILGNIALGYLDAGATPVDMAGYYQIFANGGKYTPPTAVQKLLSPDGTVLYEHTAQPVQAISTTTAQLMNKLLQEAVKPGGISQDAACGDLQVAGLTGASDDQSSNWFVGVTPGYACAVWHGKGYENQADSIFSQIMETLYATQPNANKNFITYANLQELVLCSESGLAIGEHCTQIEIGYFDPGKPVLVCPAHE